MLLSEQEWKASMAYWNAEHVGPGWMDGRAPGSTGNGFGGVGSSVLRSKICSNAGGSGWWVVDGGGVCVLVVVDDNGEGDLVATNMTYRPESNCTGGVCFVFDEEGDGDDKEEEEEDCEDVCLENFALSKNVDFPRPSKIARRLLLFQLLISAWTGFLPCRVNVHKRCEDRAREKLQGFGGEGALFPDAFCSISSLKLVPAISIAFCKALQAENNFEIGIPI